MPKIEVLCGIPCSGKSTYRKKKKDFYVISRDDARETLFGKKYQFTDKNEKRVTKYCDTLYETYIAGKDNIILDNTHCKEKYLDIYLKNVPEGYEVEFIFFDIPLWKAHVRNVIRYIWKGVWIPVNVLNSMKKNYDKLNRKKYEKVCNG